MKRFICSSCSASYPVDERLFRCRCGAPLDLEKEIRFLRARLSERPATMWRYREALPIDDDASIVTLGEGMTPLVDLSYHDLPIKAKVDYLNPTGSFKDRGASVLISFLKEIGVEHFVEDSSGNAGSAAAAYATRGGLKCEIFCPDYASPGKLVQVQAYGARLHRISGTRADTARAVVEKAEHVYYASHNWNPFFIEGLKTIAYELAEQMLWRAPDNVICPLGFGGLFLGLYLGFKELHDWKIIDKIPRIFGVQPQACAPIYQAFVANRREIRPVEQTTPTAAEGICAADPPRGKAVLKALRSCGGSVTTVDEPEIERGREWLAGQGLFVEPTSAVVVKAIDHFVADGRISADDTTVIVLTGFGLKSR